MAAESWLLPEFIVAVIRHYMTSDICPTGTCVCSHLRSISVTAMERLCLDEPPSDAPYFEAPAGLHLLAKLSGIAPESIKEFVEASCCEVYDYAQSMGSSPD